MALGPEDFTRLYEAYGRALLAFFQRRTGDAETATDLVADTFTEALERREQFRGSTDSQLGGWLWQIAQGTLHEYERRGRAQRRDPSRLGAQRHALTDEEIERIEDLAGTASLRRAVAKHLDALPYDQREALRLRFFEDLSYDEIAARLGLTPSGTRTRVTRALRLLAEELRSEREEEDE